MNFLKKLLNPYGFENKDTEPERTKENESDRIKETEPDMTKVTHTDISEEDVRPASIDVESIEDLQEVVISCIMRELQKYRGKDDFKGICLYVNDACHSTLNTKEFIHTLRLEFDNHQFRSLGAGKVEIKSGTPPANIAVTMLSEGNRLPYDKIWFSWSDAQEQQEIVKARISVVKGYGSLKTKSIVLDSSKKNRYLIGRGEISHKDGFHRVNDIIIDDACEDERMQQLNNHVSSSHADIVVHNGRYHLKAMPSGCRASGGSATMIIRDRQKIELKDVNMMYQLKSGDIIELGKSVLLEFK